MSEREDRIGGWIAIAVFFAILAIGTARSQQAQQASRIEPNQQTERLLQNEQGGNQQQGQPQEPTASTPQVSAVVGELKGQPKAQHGEEGGTEFWPAFLGYRLKITDTLIAGFTALLFWATLLLWRATRNLVQGADKTAERQLRAYVVTTNITFENINKEDEIPIAVIIYKNTGQTPAYMVTTVADFGFIDAPPTRIPPVVPNPDDPPGSAALLGPGGEHRMEVALNAPLSEANRAGLTKGDQLLHLLGTIRYVDAFGRSRFTNFNAYYGGRYTNRVRGAHSAHEGNDGN